MDIKQSTATDPSFTQVSATPESASNAKFEDRLLTVGYCHPTERMRRNAETILDTPSPSTAHAFLRLGGRWLEKAGFVTGTRVRVQVMAGCLVIKPVPMVCERRSRLPLKGTFNL